MMQLPVGTLGTYNILVSYRHNIHLYIIMQSYLSYLSSYLSTYYSHCFGKLNTSNDIIKTPYKEQNSGDFSIRPDLGYQSKVLKTGVNEVYK